MAKQQRFAMVAGIGGMMRLLSLLGTMSLFVSGALAQPLSPTAPFVIDRARSDRAPENPAPTPAEPVPVPPPENANAAITAFVLKGVRIQGTSLPAPILTDATRGFIGKTMTSAGDLTQVAQSVSNAYGNNGAIALYTITIAAQDFADGIMTLSVTEGFIEHVELRGDTDGDVTAVVAMADRLTKERPLRRATLQRYLSLIRDLPGLTAEAQMLRGQTPGAVRLVLTLNQKPYALALTLNTGGNALLGRTQIQADFSYYNLLRQGEETKFSFGTSTVFSRYQYYGVSHSELLNEDGTRAAFGYGYMRTDVGAIALSGQAQTLQLSLTHPVIRGFEENLTLGASLDGLDASNALFGTLLSSEHIRTLRLSGTYSLAEARSALTLSANLSQGLGIFDARSLFGDTGFHKLLVQGAFNRLLTEEWVVRLRAAAQVSGGPLPITELFSLGGPDFGRAFLTSAALGDQAIAGALEIGFLPRNLPGLLAGLEVFGFADQGAAWLDGRGLPASSQSHLASAGAGLRLPLGKDTRLEFTGAHRLAASVPGQRAGGWLLLAGLSTKF